MDYNNVFEQTINSFNARKNILLHTCCAPCASSVLERLESFFDVTLYFYNPNIDTQSEYNKRAHELEKLKTKFSIRDIIIEQYSPTEFTKIAKGLEYEKEGGARCRECFFVRLQKTRDCAIINGFDFFGTTLTVSPHKNAKLINDIGQEIAENTISFLCSDFKKRDGYKRSIELSKELELYRQNYCGCCFTKL